MNGGNRPHGRLIDELLAAPRENGIRVVTAIELPDDQKARLERVLRETYRRHGRITYEVDAGVIGGVSLSIGDLVIDNTIVRQLEQAEKQLGRAALVDGLTEQAGL